MNVIKKIIPAAVSLYLLSAGTVEVCDSCDKKLITEAIQVALDGDTINVHSGTYLESGITINKPLTIIGNNTIIDADSNGIIFNVNADSVTLSNLTLINTGMSYTNDIAAVYCLKVRHFLFESLIINNAQFAILVHKSHAGTIRNNTISGIGGTEAGSGNGIHLWNSGNIRISGNSISGMRDGIYFEFVDNSVIQNNNSRGNIRYGLHFMFSNNDTYRENVFERNGAGVAVMFSKNIIMEDNVFKNNWGTASYGLLLKEIYDGEIFGNQFIQNTIGINVEGSTRILYKNNLFDGNGWGIKIAGGCYDNTFTLNDFTNNSFDVSYYDRVNNNTF